MNMVARLAVSVIVLLVIAGAGFWHIYASTQDTRWLSAETIAAASQAPVSSPAAASGDALEDEESEGEFLDEPEVAVGTTGNGQIDLILSEVRTQATRWFASTMLLSFIAVVIWILYSEKASETVGGPQGLLKGFKVWMAILFALMIFLLLSSYYFYTQELFVDRISINGFLYRFWTFVVVGLVGFWAATLAGTVKMMRSSIPLGSVLP